MKISKMTTRISTSIGLMRVADVAATLIAIAACVGYVLRYVPTFIATPVTVYSDAGVFMSMFHQLSQGRRLYVDVFDHKDPLFYAGYTAAYALLGLRGPMIWEAGLSILLITAFAVFLHRVGMAPFARLGIMLVFCVLYFLPDIYIPVHTYHQATALFVLGLLLTTFGWPVAAGAAVGAAIASKMTMALLVPGWLLLVAAHDVARPGRATGRQQGMRASVGVLLSLLAVLVVLTVRGELWGYYDVIHQNLAYPSLNPPNATDFSGLTLWQIARRLFLASGVGAFIALVATASGIVVAGSYPGFAERIIGHRWARACATDAGLAGLAAGIGLATIALLWTVSWWSHHFQPVALAFALLLVPPAMLLERARAIGGPALRTTAGVLGAMLIVGASILAVRVPLVAKLSVQDLNVRAASECQLFASLARPWDVRDECQIIHESFPRGTRLATLQENGRGTLLAWTPADIVVACRAFYQFPWFRQELLDEALDCLKSEAVDVVLRQPYWLPFPSFERQALGLLTERFRLVRRHGTIEVWERQH